MKIPSQALDPANLPAPINPSGPGKTAAGADLEVGGIQGGGSTASGGVSVNLDGATLGSSSVALTAQAMNQPDVRSQLVEHFRSQIAAGTYQVSATQVADAMLSDPLTGLGRPDRG